LLIRCGELSLTQRIFNYICDVALLGSTHNPTNVYRGNSLPLSFYIQRVKNPRVAGTESLLCLIRKQKKSLAR
jgi:hypothetical protein